MEGWVEPGGAVVDTHEVVARFRIEALPVQGHTRIVPVGLDEPAAGLQVVVVGRQFGPVTRRAVAFA